MSDDVNPFFALAAFLIGGPLFIGFFYWSVKALFWLIEHVSIPILNFVLGS